MFELIRKIFKNDEKRNFRQETHDYKFTKWMEDAIEEEEIKMKKIKEHFNEKTSEYVTLRFDDEISADVLKLRVYFKGDYLGYVIVDKAKVKASDLEEEKRVIEMISKMTKDREEELEQLKIHNEIEKEKLEFMRLRNELLKKRLNKDNEEER